MTAGDGPSGTRAHELVVDARATLGEGPVWDDRRNVLWWVDIVAGLVHAYDPASGQDRSIPVGSPVGAVALRGDGTLLVAAAERLAVLDPETGTLRTLVDLPAAATPLRCNDGKCDPDGRFWIGRMGRDAAEGAGALLRFDADRTLTTWLTGLTIPNGLGWSADGGRMYFVDSTWCAVREYAYDRATGAMGEGRTLVSFPDDGGGPDGSLPVGSLPDGLTVDAEDHLWIALWGAGRVVRVSPDGLVVERIELPVSQVSSCTFGGVDLADLYITTAREDLPADALAREPTAGGLFRARPGVRGRPAVRFAG